MQYFHFPYALLTLMPRFSFSCESHTVPALCYNLEAEEQALQEERSRRVIKKDIASFQFIE